MKEILKRLIMEIKGPWKDHSEEFRLISHAVCSDVADAIIRHAIDLSSESAHEGYVVEYDFSDESIWVYVTFFERATHTAEQIAEAFEDIAGVAVNVKVSECCSEYRHGTE